MDNLFLYLTAALAGISVILLLIILFRQKQSGQTTEFLASIDKTISDRMQKNNQALREELTTLVNTFSQNSTTQVTNLFSLQQKSLDGLSNMLKDKVKEIRETVDTKLQESLETRLGESFQLVSTRLEQVYKGLGEMQKLASDVGDLKKVMTNVKTRGTWGEIQLGMILEEILTPAQYLKNTATFKGSNDRVEFAVRLPGSTDGEPVLLPIDSKFPKESYDRLIAASETGDSEGILKAGKELESALKVQAKTIAGKYVKPPETTSFAVLFLPTEGLYAEVMRRPGLAEEIQRTNNVCITGPSTLAAYLNSLQMGFRTLAIQKRSSEVWQILGAVRTEFGKFSQSLDAVKKSLESATRNIEKTQTRTRAMDRQLKTVDQLPESDTKRLLGLAEDPENEEAEG